MEQLNTLRDLFESELIDAYSAEQQMIEAMPKMIQAASSAQVKKKFEQHLKQTEQQAARLEEIFEMLDLEIEEEKCEGMAGIIKDSEKVIMMKGEPHVKDAALIAGAQKAEHYEISTYGTLCTFAETLGEDEVAEKLAQTLEEESQTDELLTSLAEGSVNIRSPKG